MRSSSEREQQEEHRPWTETRKGQHMDEEGIKKETARDHFLTSSSSILTSSLTKETFCIKPTISEPDILNTEDINYKFYQC